ncbi:YdcF family protein [Brevibacillus dissolubilis]|uniref:YdcF family protein n=1 Tax=Brevibacillus dissolubilis TaxID=1844116 RepID=UPI00159BB520|nr:YdcF family protein [Brevibacillus dissolubilis]
METRSDRIKRSRQEKKSTTRKIIGLTALSLLALAGFFFYQAGNWLVIQSEQPKKADTIIILSGDLGRLEDGARLYREGYAPYVLLTNASENALTVRGAVNHGVPESQVIPEWKADSTYANATNSKELMIQHKFKSALVVTSDYHMRRTRYIFERVYQDTGIELTYVSSKSPNFTAERWWETSLSRFLTMGEYAKMVGYWFKY